MESRFKMDREKSDEIKDCREMSEAEINTYRENGINCPESPLDNGDQPPYDDNSCSAPNAEKEDIHQQFVGAFGLQNNHCMFNSVDYDALSMPTERDLVPENYEQINSSDICKISSKLDVNADLEIYKPHYLDFALASRENVGTYINVDSEKVQYKCHLCNHVTHKETDLKLHIDFVHYNLKPHKCHLCEFSTLRKQSLKVHIESVHYNLKLNKCDFCDFSTNHKQNLKKHIKCVHLNLKQHECNWCDFSANHMHQLKEHKYYVHLNLKEHKCDLCDFSANQKYHLKGHIDSVHLNLKHKCDMCDFSTTHKNYLKRHIDSVHLNLKQHKCELCDYATHQKCNLKSHIDSVHLNLKQHKCTICTYATNQKICLQRHMDSIHSKSKRLDPSSLLKLEYVSDDESNVQ